MHLAFVEIANFRKLKRARIDLDKEKTLFVGANNSGKTSALLALRYFLYRRGGFRFGINDFTLCHQKKIRDIGQAWLANAASEKPDAPKLSDWNDVLPQLDVWIDAEESDLHYVSHILPTIDWNGGKLGVRLRVQPKDMEVFYRDYVETVEAASDAKAGAVDKDGKPIDVTLWPVDMLDFLARRLGAHFEIAAFVLDPAKVKDPVKGIATPQDLAAEIEPLDGDPFHGLLQIDDIPAHRGFSDADSGSDKGEGQRKEARKLAKQFSEYFTRHLDPTEKPDAKDILALKAIEDAQKAYDARLEYSFADRLKEMQKLGYPGITDPRVKISTLLKPIDGLNHNAAVQYEVMAATSGVAPPRLPEDYNGLGYQNLISMVFRLMSFRDNWMRVGKAQHKQEQADSGLIPPIHLVLIEEPEVHLHVQVQQVFIRNAYDVLRNHDLLRDGENFTTQLVASTHSSHVAHEVEFAGIRYFRRCPANHTSDHGAVSIFPISTVINLTDAFGDKEETSRFAKRYLRATHADLFFADAAIFIEGTAERILLPHFVKNDFKYLSECYITWLEVGGSHAHRLKPLIEKLGVLTLIITDIDACDPALNRKSARPVRGHKLETRNTTLRDWCPKRSNIDALIALEPKDKFITDGSLSAIRVAYQTEINVEHGGNTKGVCPYTFEDALALENLPVLKKMNGGGLIKDFAAEIDKTSDIDSLAQALFDALDTNKKAEFALDLLESKTGPDGLRCPTYISEALAWLQEQLRISKTDILQSALEAAVSSVSDAPAANSAATDEGNAAA